MTGSRSDQYLVAADIGRPDSDGKGGPGSGVQLPDKFDEIGGYRVRYRVFVDTEHLDESYAVGEVWNSEGHRWAEAASLFMDRDFVVRRGRPAADTVGPDSRDLAAVSAIESRGPVFVARSWRKIYVRLVERTERALIG